MPISRFRYLWLVPSLTRPGSVGLFPSAYEPSLGGVEELTRCLAQELLGRGRHTTVSTMRWPPELPVRSVIGGVDVWRGRFALPEPEPRALARFAAFSPGLLASGLRFHREHGTALIHVQCVGNNALFALAFARLLRVPLVVSLQGELTMDATQVYQRSKVLPRLLRRLFLHADAITACSRQTLDEAIAFTGIDPGDRARVVYNGVKVREFTDASPEQRAKPYVLGIGRHVHQKGFDVLLEAFAGSAAAATHELVIAGDGPERAALEAAARATNADIAFVGRTDRARTAALFRGAALFVLPSRHEPMGIVNLEAMAAGAPVVATRVGGVPELVRVGETGLLVPPDDASALRVAIDEVLGDPSLQASFGEAGQARARAFDWKAITDQYEAVYGAAAANRAGQRTRSR